MTPRILYPCLLLAAFLAACGGGGSEPTPTPVSSPSSRSQAFTPPANVNAGDQLAEAERLYAEGSFEEAIAEFQSIARSASAPARAEASWRLAQVHFERGDSDDALDALEPYVAGSDLSPQRERQAALLLGNVRLATGDLAGGEEALRSYIESGGPATPYAQIRLAGQLANREDYEGAVDLLREALTADLPDDVATEARFDIARHLEESGDAAGAIEEYDALSLDAPGDYWRGEALWFLAEFAAESDPQKAADALHSLVELYPWHDRALEALESPALALNPPTLRQRALLLFNHRINDQAAEAWMQVANDPNADVPEARWRLGILAERYEDYEGALAHYDAVISAFIPPTTAPILGQALWDRALVLELLGRTDEAIAAFTAVTDRAPESEHAGEALFRAGWYTLRAGNPAAAADIWQRYEALAAPGHETAEAYFWLAQAYSATGQGSAATNALILARDAAPLDFWGLRAAAELSGAATFPVQTSLRDQEPDLRSIETWLTDVAGPRPTGNDSALDLERGLELRNAGLKDDADAEFDAALDRAYGNRWALYDLARTAHKEGLPELQTRAAYALSRYTPDVEPSVLATAAPAAPPAALFQLVYPVVYRDLVDTQSAANGVDPYLLLALMRQESLYTPDAGSPAGALGLLQIIPDTGEYVAQQLGETNYTTLDLFRAKTSIKFGAWYLGTQLEGFGGRPEAALAAYNGGPGNAGRWLDTAGTDRDVFIETIDYSETRAYVELVLENYALYLWAYGLADEPSIPFGE